MNNLLQIIGRKNPLFLEDIMANEKQIVSIISCSSFLVIGGAGSIGQAVTKEIFKRNPKLLHVVDISENNLVELVRDMRSSLGYIKGDFRTFAIDCGSVEFDRLIQSGCKYDYVLNLSALKHVRSEKDPFTLMRLVEVNILNTLNTIDHASRKGVKKYFCVSTDKAANPVNMMGASKRIMEMFLMRASENVEISTARFANVAFSDGSLLYGFTQRVIKKQPLAAPKDVKRYFITPQESGELCLMSCLLGYNRDIFFPKLNDTLDLIKLPDIAIRYLHSLGYQAFECDSEEEARERASELIANGYWPCYFFESDTTGEKCFEEFFTDTEVLDLNRFNGVGVVKPFDISYNDKLEFFIDEIRRIRSKTMWDKKEILELFRYMVPEFLHLETGKNLDQKM
jgi:FlaA1/EpsC-like NDP-sugar epimerase